MTVNGPVRTDQAGITLTHEHILVDFIGADSTGYFRWNRDSVVLKALPEVLRAKAEGVSTFFDCTPEFLGRDPVLLKTLSERSGINIITNTGYYGYNMKYLPESFYQSSPEKLAEMWIGEFENGIEGTGIRPGFIKIAVNPADSLSPADQKIIKAAALTHLGTGLTIASHTGPEKPAFEQLAVLRSLGIHPSAFIWVHAQRGSLESNIEAAREGAWISLDKVHYDPAMKPGDVFSIEWYAERISELKNLGLINRILLSHDSGWYDPAKPGGGNFKGYTDLFKYLIPAMKEHGLSDEDLRQMLVINPAEAFKVGIRRISK
jgi:phosphotriesterase-related protein